MQFNQVTGLLAITHGEFRSTGDLRGGGGDWKDHTGGSRTSTLPSVISWKQNTDRNL